jgi:hypothetical protein
MTILTFEEVKKILNECHRNELRDHAFGDREIYWWHPKLGNIAEGYSGRSVCFSMNDENGTEVQFDRVFTDSEIESLFKLGTMGKISRNDSTGPDTYTEGTVMPGLTLNGILNELISTK